MKKYVWTVITIVLFFLGLIITYTLVSPDRNVASEAATAAEKAH